MRERTAEWNRRETKIIALSVDSVEKHRAWVPDVTLSHAKVGYPIIGDPDKKVADLYDVIHPGEDPPELSPVGLHHRAGQPHQADAGLAEERGSQLRRGAPSPRRAPSVRLGRTRRTPTSTPGTRRSSR